MNGRRRACRHAETAHTAKLRPIRAEQRARAAKNDDKRQFHPGLSRQPFTQYREVTFVMRHRFVAAAKLVLVVLTNGAIKLCRLQ